MKKSIFSVSLIAVLSLPVSDVLAAACECGTHATGITTWNVGNNEGCCSGTAGAVAFTNTYAADEDGTWQLINIETITGAQAQALCCKPG